MSRSILIINYETEGVNPRLCANSRASVMRAVRDWNCSFTEINHSNHPLTLAPAATKTELFSNIPGDEVLVLDSDVVIRQDCPNPFEYFPEDCMTVVQNTSHRFGEYGIIKQIEVEEWAKVEAEFGPASYDTNAYFNSGMMVVRKDLHAEVFKMAMNMHIILSQKAIGLGWVDQTLFNYATRKLGIKMHMADETWNFVHPEQLPDWTNMQKYIYHFAGTPDRNQKMPLMNWQRNG